MKKIYALILAVLIILSLTACSSANSSNTYTVTKDDTVFTVDTENLTISDGENIYSYIISDHDIEIIYPDGTIYKSSANGNAAVQGGLGEELDLDRYVDGDVLCEVLEEELPSGGNINPLIILLLFIIGFVNLVFPYKVWYLGYGWRFKNAEPSDSALITGRVIGAVLIIIAVVLIFV